jgi:transcriptional regulator with XRE-family HTH domain
MKLGTRLKTYRRENKKSVRQMARRSGLSNPFLCQLENSPDKTWLNVSVLSLLRIVRAYNLPLEEVLPQIEELAKKQKGYPEC